MNAVAPSTYDVEFNTTVGVFVVRMVREWAPRGVDRVYNLVRNGFYDDTRIYRVLPQWVVQFGVSGSPAVSAVFNAANRPPTPGAVISDDPVRASNDVSYMSFSCSYDEAMSHATNRTTELYINSQDNAAALDALGFAPVGRVVQGMDVVRSFYAGYGEMADACSLHGFEPCAGPLETRLYTEGNSYLDVDFPLLDHILTATVLDLPSAAESEPNLLLSLGAAAVLASMAFICTCTAIRNGGSLLQRRHEPRGFD